MPFLEKMMNLSLFANRRLWFVLGFALLLLLSVSYALTETTLGASLTTIYLPQIFKSQLCGTIPC